VALHPLPAPETVAETLFIRRRDGAVSAALGAFIGHVSPAAVPDAAE
jgi:hypothetical protein